MTDCGRHDRSVGMAAARAAERLRLAAIGVDLRRAHPVGTADALPADLADLLRRLDHDG